MGIFRNQRSANYAFAQKSACENGRGRRPYVCCTTDTGFVDRSQLKGQRIIFPNDENGFRQSTIKQQPSTERPQRDVYSQDTALFPKPPVCGPISVVNKIYGGEDAELGEFPWLVNLEHRKGK